MSDGNKLPTWFWVVSGIALVWNLMGLGAFFAQVMASPEQIAAMPEAHQELHHSTPGWVNIVFAVAVFGGVIGSVGLLMKKAWASMAFLASLAGVLLQSTNTFFLSNAVDVLGNQAIFGPLIVIIGAVALLWFSNMTKEKGWLN
ncbi:MAG: hypothetical protein ACRBF0_25270 [Calditrichia bacterium]